LFTQEIRNKCAFTVIDEALVPKPPGKLLHFIIENDDPFPFDPESCPFMRN